MVVATFSVLEDNLTAKYLSSFFTELNYNVQKSSKCPLQSTKLAINKGVLPEDFSKGTPYPDHLILHW